MTSLRTIAVVDAETPARSPDLLVADSLIKSLVDYAVPRAATIEVSDILEKIDVVEHADRVVASLRVPSAGLELTEQSVMRNALPIGGAVLKSEGLYVVHGFVNRPTLKWMQSKVSGRHIVRCWAESVAHDNS